VFVRKLRQKIERDPRDGKALGFAFKPPERSGRVVFEVEDGTLEVGEPPGGTGPAAAPRADARNSRSRLPAGPSSAKGRLRLVAPWRWPRRLG
jgi:hypothetical protein